MSEEGAIASQTAEQAETQAAANAQVVSAAEAQVRAETQALAARQQRRTAQLAAIQRAEQNLAFATLVAPFSGIITERPVETGDLIRPGEAVVRVGQFDPSKLPCHSTTRNSRV
ncbi:MAG: hypothetical protein HC926_03520, partial [Synechococcaceae cyanobacterium SM2_3_60]|nr:hypothetical protein [Synechococcaceae cyanobacterium SM2_3_60]